MHAWATSMHDAWNSLIYYHRSTKRGKSSSVGNSRRRSREIHPAAAARWERVLGDLRLGVRAGLRRRHRLVRLLHVDAVVSSSNQGPGRIFWGLIDQLFWLNDESDRSGSCSSYMFVKLVTLIAAVTALNEHRIFRKDITQTIRSFQWPGWFVY